MELTIRLKLEPNVLSYPVPANKDTDTFASEVAMQGTAWFPNNLLNNRLLNDDDTFTVTGDEAVYFRDLINSGQITFLEIVT